jgi:TP901 family phage tail tape measure protein
MARIELNIVALGDFKSVDSQIKGLRAQVDLLNKSLTGTGLSSNLSKQLNDANAAFKASMLSTGQFTETTVKLKTETEKFGQSLVSGKLKLNEYFSIIRGQSSAAAASMRALAVEQTKLQNSIVTADPTKKGVFSVYTPTNIDQIANKTKIATNYQNLFNIAVDKGSQSLINWGKNTQWAGRQLTVGLTVPMAMFGSAAMKTFQQVNDELVRLQKVYGTGLTQPTTKALNDIKAQVTSLSRELASTMGVSAKDTAAMAADLAATGKTGNDLLVATREAMRLSKLGELDTQSAMQATVSLQNVYKLSTQDLSKSIDFLNAVENQTSTSLQDLVDGIPRVGPIVQQLGGSFKDTAVMMVAMKEAGVPAAQSANAIKSALASLINPTKAAKNAFAAYNINLAGIATSTKGNPVQMIMELQKALKGLAPLAQAQLIEKLFGKFQEARIQALITNLGAVNSQTKTAFDLVNASAPQLAAIAANEMKVATESTTGRFKRAVETIKADIIPIGEKIMEVATVLLKFGDSIAKAFGSLPGPVKSVIGILAGAAALVGPIIMLVGLMGNFAGYIMKTVFNLKNLITGTKTFGELFTPEMIASQNAAELFGNKILQDVGAVDLLNQSVTQLINNLNAMQSGMATGTGAGIITPGTISTTEKNSIYSYASRAEAAALFGYSGTTGENVYSKPTSGVFSKGDRIINGGMANEGVAPQDLINAMTAVTGETKDKSKMFKTSGSEFLNATIGMNKNGTSLISEENANKIKAELNAEFEKELLGMSGLVNDINNPYSKVAEKVIKKNANLANDPEALIAAYENFNTSSSKTQKIGNRSGGGGATVNAAGYNSVYVKLAGSNGEEFYHAYNEKFLKVRAKIVEDFRQTGVKASKKMIDGLAKIKISDEIAASTSSSLEQGIVQASGQIEKKGLFKRLIGNKIGLGMGMALGGQMLSSALPQGSNASSLAGNVSSFAGAGMMFGGYGALAGAVLGAAVSGVQLLMKAEKEHAAMAKATFTSSSDAVSFFGDKVADTTHRMLQFQNIAKITGPALDQIAAGMSYTNKEFDSFKKLVESLPKDNPLALVSQRIKNASDDKSAQKIAEDFAHVQMAINNISQQDADKLMQLLLSMNGRNAAGAGVTAANQLQAIKATLNSLKPGTKEFSSFMQSLTDLAVNTTSWDTYKAVITAVGDSAKTSKAFVDGLVQSLASAGDFQGVQNVASFKAQGYSPIEILTILASGPAGVGVNTTGSNVEGYTNLKPGDTKSLDKIQSQIKKSMDARSAATKAAADAQATLTRQTQDSLKPLEAQQKILEENLKTLQDAQKQRQQNNSFATTKEDLKNQILMAQANGDNLKAQLLQQELMSKSQDYGFQQKIDTAQKAVDAGAKQIADLKANADANAQKIVNQVKASGEETAAAAAKPPLVNNGTNKSNATNLGSVSSIKKMFPEFKTSLGGSLNPSVDPSQWNNPWGFMIGPGSARANIKRLAAKVGYSEGKTFAIDHNGIRYKFKVVKDGNVEMIDQSPINSSQSNSKSVTPSTAPAPTSKSIWSTLGSFFSGGKPIGKFNSPSVSAASYSPSNIASQTVNNGGVTVNNTINVGTVNSPLDFQKILDENNKKMANIFKMGGTTSIVGGRR